MDYEVALKLLLAAFLGGCIGLERELREKPAGLRTNMLICIGSTVFMIISMQAGKVYGDYTRIAAQIVTGIGFLGAGAVLHSHGFVLGLTTAATIWVVAAVGMAIGAGFYTTALLATVISMGTLTFMSYLEQHLQGTRIFSYSLTVTRVDSGIAVVKQALQELAVEIPGFNFRKDNERHKLWFNVTLSRDRNLKLLERLSQSPDILQVENGMSAQDFMHPLRPHDE